MPSHDGRGYFFTPPDHSPSASELDYNHLPIRTHSLSSLSENNSLDGHRDDDLLSISSSLSLTPSASSSSSDLRPHTHQQAEMSPEEAELLLTPMAISAGLSHHTSSSPIIQRPAAVSSRSSHRSLDPRAPPRTTRSRRTLSRSSRRSPITPIAPSARNHPPIVIIPPASASSSSSSDKKINQLSPSRIAALSFLSNVASKILDLDSDTISLLSSPYDPQPPQNQPHQHLLQPRPDSSKTTKRRGPPRFSIGDDDPRLPTTHDQDMVSPPLDLSGFMPPSACSVWRTPSSSAGFHQRPRSHPLPSSPDNESSSTDSMATVLLSKVLNEWTNW
ncbi:hypothetical protein PtA15_1A103 [Puccinia triticina]|uniref:Uncharacterized protein n=1 Tax=Puccinia triticina TaxID=208348 RepID=A0ABY7CA48_9BASI|nr:uncharacterized protein PtA15_1A103 [Puccinia triticina]WAQ80765.1 hypothetical protein PtA15_1A103 [Puccinia triticina]WAR51656.1 hypothetical protein PtB15_1B92 [Puccinia triticina]